MMRIHMIYTRDGSHFSRCDRVDLMADDLKDGGTPFLKDLFSAPIDDRAGILKAALTESGECTSLDGVLILSAEYALVGAGGIYTPLIDHAHGEAPIFVQAPRFWWDEDDAPADAPKPKQGEMIFMQKPVAMTPNKRRKRPKDSQ